ncbi:hypothetical protein ACLKA7_016483 [Drosophila subpalustris]
METNRKLRETYLKKSHTMVWEQQTIRRILDDYNRKLNAMLANDAPKKYDKKVPTRNDKLFELFKSNDLETETDITKKDNAKSVDKAEETESADEIEDNKSSPEHGTGKQEPLKESPEKETSKQDHVKKRKISEDDRKDTTEVAETTTTCQIAINTPADALRHLAALQEYAMLNDNYRASGLLIQVEKAFKNPPNSNDFEL